MVASEAAQCALTVHKVVLHICVHNGIANLADGLVVSFVNTDIAPHVLVAVLANEAAQCALAVRKLVRAVLGGDGIAAIFADTAVSAVTLVRVGKVLVLALSGLLSAADAVFAIGVSITLVFGIVVLVDVRRGGVFYLHTAFCAHSAMGSVPIIELKLRTTTRAVLLLSTRSECSGAQAHSHDQAQQHAYNFLHLLVLLSHLFCVCVYFAGYSRG